MNIQLKILLNKNYLNYLSLINSFSFLLIISTKNSCVDIRTMKGKISKSVEGTFKKVIKKGKYASELDSVKNVISSNKVKINVKEKKNKSE